MTISAVDIRRSRRGFGDIWDDYAADEEEIDAADDLASDYEQESDPYWDDGGAFDEGLFVESEDGAIADYGTDPDYGEGTSAKDAAEIAYGEMFGTTVLGEGYKNPEAPPSDAELANIAADAGRQQGYHDGTNGKPYNDAAITSSGEPLPGFAAAIYKQKYAEGYALGQAQKGSGGAIGGGPKPSAGGALPGSGSGSGTSPTADSGMSTGMKVGLAALGAAAAIGVGVVVMRRRRRRSA